LIQVPRSRSGLARRWAEGPCLMAADPAAQPDFAAGTGPAGINRASQLAGPEGAAPGTGGPEKAEFQTAQQSPRRVLRSRGVLALLGPAFVAAVAYIDPGNFASNFTAGAVSGYALAWAVVV